MDISEVAKMSGLPVSTIRYYDDQGLIKSTGRSGLRRQFNNSVVERLAMISLGSSVGFSLLEMKHMLTEQGAEINRELLMAKADELDNQIKKLVTMRNGLRHAAICAAPSHLECPKFLRILKVVSKRRTVGHSKY